MAARSWRSMTDSVSPARALLGSLADGRDRSQAVRHGAGDLAPDGLVGLAVVLAALRVAEDDEAGDAGEHERARLAGERAPLLGSASSARRWPALVTNRRLTASSQMAGGQMTVRDRGHSSAASATASASAIASSRVGGFIFQLPATIGLRITCPPRVASSTSRRSRWFTADRLTPSAAASVSRSASGMRRRIAAVSRSAGDRRASVALALKPSDGRQLPVGGTHRAAEVGLLGVDQPVQPGSHVAADALRLELEHAAVGTRSGRRSAAISSCPLR